MNFSKVHDDYYHMVNRISSEYASKFKMVDKADVLQELWLWFVSHPNKTEEWMALENQKDGDKLFARSLRNAALDYCLKEKAVKEGYNYSDNFWYTKDFIKMLIPAVLSDDWTKLDRALSNTTKNTKSLAESGDWMAYAADIKSAFGKLSETEQNLVFLFYAEELEGKDLHETIGEDKPTARATMMQANRALAKMVKYLGGYPPFADYDEVTVKEEKIDDMSVVP
jgi:DNA-directed RNA polymerase specialized sigma24 family protein